MLKRLAWICGLVLLVSGCSAPAAVIVKSVSTVSMPAVLPPDQVAAQFYDWYIEEQAPGEMRNRLSDRSYRQSEFLTPGMVAKVDRLTASLDGGGYDPFLCAQDIPSSLTFSKPTVAGDRATVVVQTSFVGHLFTLTFEDATRWKIADITCNPSTETVVPPLKMQGDDEIEKE